MISTPDRQRAVALINEAIDNGSCKSPACREIGITLRTFERWTRAGEISADHRPLAVRPVPSNKLSDAERAQVLETEQAINTLDVVLDGNGTVQPSPEVTQGQVATRHRRVDGCHQGDESLLVYLGATHPQ